MHTHILLMQIYYNYSSLIRCVYVKCVVENNDSGHLILIDKLCVRQMGSLKMKIMITVIQSLLIHCVYVKCVV